MPNLTPIALTEEEHQRLTTIKHKLEANSWREMLMKLCDLYDQFCEAEQPITPTEQDLTTMVEKIIDEKLANHETKNPDLFDQLKPKKESEEINGEKIQQLVREEMKKVLENHEFKIEMPQSQPTQEKKQEEKPKGDTCPSCGTFVPYNIKECPECGEVFED